ncbi:unnamed protein product, partial [Mesorhabditis spiculigera]
MASSPRGWLVYAVLLLALAGAAYAQYYVNVDGAEMLVKRSDPEHAFKRNNNNLNNMFRIGKRKLGNMMRLG